VVITSVRRPTSSPSTPMMPRLTQRGRFGNCHLRLQSDSAGRSHTGNPDDEGIRRRNAAAMEGR
jgi:hypothetical protein